MNWERLILTGKPTEQRRTHRKRDKKSKIKDTRKNRATRRRRCQEPDDEQDDTQLPFMIILSSNYSINFSTITTTIPTITFVARTAKTANAEK